MRDKVVSIEIEIVNLKIKKPKWEATNIYLRSKKIAVQEALIQAENPYSVLLMGGKHVVFMRMGREMIRRIEERNFCGVNKLTKGFQ